jgi:hypothetical protein
MAVLGIVIALITPLPSFVLDLLIVTDILMSVTVMMVALYLAPKDRRQAEGLVELHRELEVACCQLVTISTDNITLTNEYRSGVGAHWPFLSDAGRIVQKDLDIGEYTDPVNNPMIPHVIVLEPGLVVYKIYNGYWFFGRPTLEALRLDLRAVTKKCRPDWDITTPELKAAWQQGRKELLYPYGKTYAQTLGEQD